MGDLVLRPMRRRYQHRTSRAGLYPLVGLLVLLGLFQWFGGLYVVPPAEGARGGHTAVVWRTRAEPFFNSPAVPGWQQGPAGSVLVARLPYWDWAYQRSLAVARALTPVVVGHPAAPASGAGGSATSRRTDPRPAASPAPAGQRAGTPRPAPPTVARPAASPPAAAAARPAATPAPPVAAKPAPQPAPGVAQTERERRLERIRRELDRIRREAQQPQGSPQALPGRSGSTDPAGPEGAVPWLSGPEGAAPPAGTGPTRAGDAEWGRQGGDGLTSGLTPRDR